jgi:DNA ligase-1
MLLADVVATSGLVAADRARTAKSIALADLLRRLEPAEVVPVIGLLVGEPRQGRIGIGWTTVFGVEVPTAEAPMLSVEDVDRTLDRLATTSGPGSVAARNELLSDLLGRATEGEAAFLRKLLVGELRQGALEGVMVDAVARAAGVPAPAVRRALMLSGDLGTTAETALTAGLAGLKGIGLEVLRPLAPMLASPADSVAEALVDAGGPASVEWKLDGVRLQVHRHGDAVRLFTRNLNDVTHRLPEVVDIVRSLPARSVVLDGEVIGLHDEDDRPHLFQDVMAGFGREDHQTRSLSLRPFFFDCLHLDGIDLIDRPLSERQEALSKAVGPLRMPGIVTDDADQAAEFLDRTLAAGHEGVVVKGLSTTYEAGRRGRAWRKVKVAHTLDLVVLAAEWGHGRRRGWLSNLHLGARHPDDPGRFIMVGKTFKGMTDQVLAWQTDALQQLEVERRGIEVHVRPELVVEIELDGAQVSTRYPGGAALRFARLLRYRPDKRPDEADTIDAVRALLPRSAS